MSNGSHHTAVRGSRQLATTLFNHSSPSLCTHLSQPNRSPLLPPLLCSAVVAMLPSHSLDHCSGDVVSLTLTILADSSVNVSILPLDLSHSSSLLTLCAIPILTATVPTAPPLHPLSHYFASAPSSHYRPARSRCVIPPRHPHASSAAVLSPATQSFLGLSDTAQRVDAEFCHRDEHGRAGRSGGGGQRTARRPALRRY